MGNYVVVTTKEVTPEQVDHLLADAFENSGISYWCGEVRVKESPDGGEYEYASEALTRGHTLLLFDMEESNPETNHKTYGVWKELTLDKLLKAIGERNVDFEQYDGPEADAVVQTAIFGEVVYG